MEIDQESEYEQSEIEYDVYLQFREQVPYLGLAPLWSDYALQVELTEMDETAKDIQYFLMYIGEPGLEINHPSDWDNSGILGMVLENALSYDVSIEPASREVLNPIIESVGTNAVYLKEHVEAAARELLGEEIVVEHTDLPFNENTIWTWHEDEGVYTPPEAGGSIPPIPVIFNYEEVEGQYIVEVTYFSTTLHWVDDTYDGYPEILAEQKEEAANHRPRYEVVLSHNDKGSFTFASCTILG